VHNKMTYRPDIDGLRAVAVLAVLFYHAGISGFSGGYVGVDVFFVISGFLITKKISESILANDFTFIGFYERRIRRIFPALFATIFFALGIGYLIYDTPTFQELGQSATATTLFSSNIFFWRQAGYFDGPAALKPLLHMWSLSVEEQFYFGLPLLLVSLHSIFKKNVRSILIGLACLSFLIVSLTLGRDPSAAFYLVQGRIWELLLGSILALSQIGKIKSQHRAFLSVGGILMILASIAAYSDETRFPGAAAALPVFGSGMIILSGIDGESLIGRVLSTKPFVFVGKISYSLYLWHWPLLVFARFYLIRELGPVDLALWFIITFLAAFLSWKIIETPFRSLSFLAKPRIFYLAGSVLVLTALLGYMIDKNKGLPNRITSEQAVILDKTEWHSEAENWLNCNTEKGQDVVICPIGAAEQPPTFLLWGDSHSRAVAPAVNRSATSANQGGIFIWKTGCPPLTGIDRLDHSDQECSAFSQAVISLIEDDPEIKTVILASRWAISAVGTRYKNEEGISVTLIDATDPTARDQDNAALFTAGLERTLEELHNLDRQVILVGPIAEVGYHVPSSYFIASRTGRDINSIIAPTRGEFLARNDVVISVLDEMGVKYDNLQIINPAGILCDMEVCPVVLESYPLYIDDDHLSTFGAYQIAELFDPVFNSGD